MIAVLEAESEAHKTLATNLSTDCAKALKAFSDQQIKTREPVRGGGGKKGGREVEGDGEGGGRGLEREGGGD